jgi:putative Mn2+ efflux pump MntP
VLGPLVLIVVGVLFLLNNMYPGVFRFGKMWPVILIVIGLFKVVEFFRGPRTESTDTKKEGQL